MPAAEIPAGVSGYKSRVAKFFQTHCIDCHGPKLSKGKITLHALNGDLSAGHELERWELILMEIGMQTVYMPISKHCRRDREALHSPLCPGANDSSCI